MLPQPFHKMAFYGNIMEAPWNHHGTNSELLADKLMMAAFFINKSRVEIITF
jgi:hypothetical protein